MQKIITILSFVLIPGLLFAQSYDKPESAVYDPVNDQYLISNKGSGEILAADKTTHNLSNYITSGLDKPQGMCIENNKLYVADVDQVHIIDLNSDSVSQSVSIPNSTALNDVTSDGDSILISDRQEDKIFSMSTDGSGTGVTCSSWSLDKPNGILYDSNGDLLVVSFVDNSPIQKINRASATVGFQKGTQLSKLDGLTQDPSGTYYVSSWASDAVYEFQDTLNTPTPSDKVVTGVVDPADIYYDGQHDVLVVPNFTDNSVDFIDKNAFGVDENRKEAINIYPNPTDKNVYIEIPNQYINNESMGMLYSTDGRLVRNFKLEENYTLSELTPGIYILQLELAEKTNTQKVIITE